MQSAGVEFVRVAAGRQRETVASLAAEIWTEHYVPIIGAEQVQYMLGRFQSKQAVTEQIASGVLYYLMRKEGRWIGYLAVQPRDEELFLSKIYVKAAERSRGYGRSAVRFAESLARERGLRKIVLTVNRHNAIAIRAYENTGFRKTGCLVQEIGGGFVMDDYRMEKPVGTDEEYLR